MASPDPDEFSSLKLAREDEAQTFTLYEETARVEKREHEEQVAVRTTVQLRDEVVEAMLRSDVLDIERVKLDQVVDAAPGIREEGDLLIIPVLEEILFVEKRLILREEIRIRRTEQSRTARETVRLRREEAVIERSPPAPQPTQEL